MSQIILSIDGKIITTNENKTILEAALDNGIYIPHLCSHEDLHPNGGCRLCVVKQEGVEELVTSCSTKVEQGMVINTKDEIAEKVRKLSCDLMFKTHPDECTGCPKYGKCQLQSISQYVGDTGRNLRSLKIRVGADETNPLMIHEMYRCILCGRCVRACEDLRGVGALKFEKVNGRIQVVVNGGSLKEAGCRFCGACVEVCPTGSIRDKVGVIKEGVPREKALIPCMEGCPASIEIPKYIRFLKEGKYSEAAATVREKAPFPSVLGHICTHDCEMACKRNYLNEAVSIRNLKRFAAAQEDEKFKNNGFHRDRSGKKVAIVGSGPAGMTAAFYLAKCGHEVTVFEKLPKAGGMMRYGIPAYRLPDEILDKEIEDILKENIEIKYNSTVKSIDRLMEEGYNAALICVGTHAGARLPLKGNDLKDVWINTEFLQKVSQKEKIEIGDKVVVLGGGNVAIDCAGSALRLGAKEVHMVCLEREDEMKASEEEILWAKEEGINIHNAKTFLEITSKGGKVSGLSIMGVKSFYFDENGKAVLNTQEGSEENIEADTIIFAVGQSPDLDETFGVELGRGNRIKVDERTMKTNRDGIYAAGDAVTGTASVIKAIAGARIAATEIDIFLGGNGDISEKLAPDQFSDDYIGKIDGIADAKRTKTDVDKADIRCHTFDLMDHGFTSEDVACETKRCLQCDLRVKIKPQKFWNDYVMDQEERTWKK